MSDFMDKQPQQIVTVSFLSDGSFVKHLFEGLQDQINSLQEENQRLRKALFETGLPLV